MLLAEIQHHLAIMVESARIFVSHGIDQFVQLPQQIIHLMMLLMPNHDDVVAKTNAKRLIRFSEEDENDEGRCIFSSLLPPGTSLK